MRRGDCLDPSGQGLVQGAGACTALLVDTWTLEGQDCVRLVAL